MPSVSPRTQQLQSQNSAGNDQATQLMEQGFSDMAQRVLLAKNPDLMPNIVTFRVLNVDADMGNGVGAFVLRQNNRMLYVPVVMSKSLVKPMDMAYDKELNVFLPLTKEWLAEVDKLSLGQLGQGVKTPDTLYSDVDIRNIVIPPVTGRFSYASYVENIEATRQRPAKMFLQFLSNAPNNVKVAYYNTISKYPKILKAALDTYGLGDLQKSLSLKTEKVAAKQLYGGGLWIADKDTDAPTFKRVFGDKSGEAYIGVKTKGYAYKDTRTSLNKAMQIENQELFESPSTPGVYAVRKHDGKEMCGFISTVPVDVFQSSKYARRKQTPGHVSDPDRAYPYGRPQEQKMTRGYPRLLVVFPSGDYLEVNDIAAERRPADDISSSVLYTALFGDKKGMSVPKTGKGIFIRKMNSSYESTRPITVESITTGSDGIKRLKIKESDYWGEWKTLVYGSSSTGAINAPASSNIVYVPASFIWVPLKNKLEDYEFFLNAHDLRTHVADTLRSKNVKKASVYRTREDTYAIDDEKPVSKIAALKDIAARYYLPVEDVEAILNKTAESPRVNFYSVHETTLKSLFKAAEDDKKDKKDSTPKKKSPPSDSGGDPSDGGDPNADPNMDPNADPGIDPNSDPSMMGAGPPMPPPPPSPSDLAAMEMQQQIEAEMQKLQEKQIMLQQLTARTQEIATGAPVAPTVQSQAMGAPPPSVNLATGAPTPAIMGQQGMAGAAPQMMDSSQMGGGMGGAAPQMDPSQMGMGGGMDAGMGSGGMGGGMGMDPSQMGMPGQGQQMPPTPMMTDDSLNSSTIESQINPQFLGEAAQLQDSDAFDAASIATMAQSPNLKEEVAQYIPNLTKTLDNLGRIILTLRIQEPELEDSLGGVTFSDIENRAAQVFKNLGNLILGLNQNSEVLRSKDDSPTA